VSLTSEVVTVRASEPLPDSWRACVLLGDTTPFRWQSADNHWRTDLAEMLRLQWSGDGRLVIALQDSGPARDESPEEKRWSRIGAIADVAAYWWPDDTDPRLEATLAACHDGHPLVYGTSTGVLRAGQAWQGSDHNLASAVTSLSEMAAAILESLDRGAYRAGGERDVPLSIWRTDSFQRWYRAQMAAGNTLLAARLVWTFNIGSKKPVPLFWALHVSMHIGGEDRVKANEVVISRPDISTMTLYRPGPSIDETVVVLIREFRGPASTPDGLVHELPGGSGGEASELDQAIMEAEEEVGITIEPRRVRAYGGRQLAGTLSAHQAHLFAAEISDEELSRLRSLQSVPHGNASDTELTWTEIATFREVRQKRLVDWATIGMIAQVLFDYFDESPGS
jgi:8-oxo-dGTP pyrophosphatase MutT (NUDIX family)